MRIAADELNQAMQQSGLTQEDIALDAKSAKDFDAAKQREGKRGVAVTAAKAA